MGGTQSGAIKVRTLAAVRSINPLPFVAVCGRLNVSASVPDFVLLFHHY